MEEFEIYKALGDPIRLEMVKRLSDQQPLILTDLLKNLGVTRQGARKQLQVLKESGVVTLRSMGRETEVTLKLEALEKARKFIAMIEEKWDERLQNLKAFVESKES